MLLDFVLQWVFWLFEFYDGVINFLTEFRNFRPIKFSDNLELSASDLNFRVVSGFGELFKFPTGFHCLSSAIRFWCIFWQWFYFRTHSIFWRIQFSAATFSRVGLVTTRHQIEVIYFPPCWSKMADRVRRATYNRSDICERRPWSKYSRSLTL